MAVMARSSIRRFVATLFAAFGAAACGHSAATAQTSPQPAPATTTGGDVGGQPYTEADVRFMTTMIGHHAQAIHISRLAPTHDASPAVQRLAERIINAQEDEIAIMQQWLRDRGKPVPEARPAAMTHGGDHHQHLMPGMLTQAQLEQLDRARGEEFDRLFLQFMIQHHNGAVSMVKELIGTPGAAHDNTVFKLASDINVDQTTEIERMRQMLVGLLVEPRSP
jgi:uncharacterized protein (DUF305 family)